MKKELTDNEMIAEARETFKKAKISLRYWLMGRCYLSAVKAMEYALNLHKGTRKDGFTPTFYHQLSMAHYARAFEKLLIYPEETYGTIFLHDVPEDFLISHVEINTKFGLLMADASCLLSRKNRDGKISDEEYYKDMHTDPIASVCKGLDRVHNLQSMLFIYIKYSVLCPFILYSYYISAIN